MNLVEEKILKYCVQHSNTPSSLACELFEYTKKNVHGSQMLIGEMEASVLGLIIHLRGISSILEFGTYTGYSALAMAEQLPAQGHITTIDINEDTVAIARKYWLKSPDGYKIRSILKPGIEAIQEIHEHFDLIFIDADKNNYSNYLNWAIQHLNPRGIIITDNTLWSGKVLTEGLDKQTDSIRAHNEAALKLNGFYKTLLPIRDGMYVLAKMN